MIEPRDPTVQTPGTTWAAEIDVDPAEQIDLTIAGYSYNGKKFRTARLRLSGGYYRRETVLVTMSGPLIRKDGSLGVINASEERVDKIDVTRLMPNTWKLMQEQLAVLRTRLAQEAASMAAKIDEAAS